MLERSVNAMPKNAELSAAVITVSDSSFAGEREDASGPAVAAALEDAGFTVIVREVVPDEQKQIAELIIRLAAKVQLVVTTGGTGLAPRDITPEATKAVCQRLVEGIPQVMRAEGFKKTQFAALSRGVCGVIGTSLVLNLPGSPQGAVESLAAVIHLLPHCLNLIAGHTQHD